jgi:hypothetical protein
MGVNPVAREFFRQRTAYKRRLRRGDSNPSDHRANVPDDLPDSARVMTAEEIAAVMGSRSSAGLRIRNRQRG